MTNSAKKAGKWIDFLSSVPEIPFAGSLRAHFDAGEISRLCDCGCNSFDVKISPGIALTPLLTPDGKRSAKFFEIAFESDADVEVAFLFFSDARGYLTGIDITCGSANHGAVPDSVTLGKVLYII